MGNSGIGNHPYNYNFMDDVKGYGGYQRTKEVSQGAGDKNVSEEDKTENGFSKALQEYGKMLKKNIESGDNEPSYQIGGASYTEEEWNKLIKKVDKDIDKIKEEQAERLEKKKEKEAWERGNMDEAYEAVKKEAETITVQDMLSSALNDFLPV